MKVASSKGIEDSLEHVDTHKLQRVAQVVLENGALKYSTSKKDQPHNVERSDPL